MAIGFVNFAAANGGAAAVTTLAVPVPTGTASGHLMVIHLTSNVATAITTPTGWTVIKTSTTTTTSMGIFYRWATASEPASYTFTLPSAKAAGVMYSFSGVDTTTPLDVAVPVATAGTTAVTFTAITPVTAGALVMGFASYLNATTPPTTPTSTNLTNLHVSGSTAASAAVNAVAAMGYATWASGAFTANMTLGTTSRTLGQSLALRPAATAAVAQGYWGLPI